MSRRTRSAAGVVTLIFTLAVTVCTGGAAPETPKPADSKKEYRIRLAGLYPAQHPFGQADDRFAEIVTQKSDGRIKVEVFPNMKLGSERESAEGIKMGTLEMMETGSGGIGNFMPAVQVLELPYIYKDFDHLKRVSEHMPPQFAKMFLNQGLRLLGYYYDGPRSTLAVKPLRKFEDFKSLKWRVPQSPLYVSMTKALGATPTPIPLPEAYNALQTKVAEAIEGSPSTLYNGKYYEVAKYLTMTKHVYYLCYLVVNEKFYQSLPKDLQKVVDDVGQAASEYEFQRVIVANQGNYDKMKAAGTEFIEIADLAPFQNAVKALNANFAKGISSEASELLTAVLAVK